MFSTCNSIEFVNWFLCNCAICAERSVSVFVPISCWSVGWKMLMNLPNRKEENSVSKFVTKKIEQKVLKIERVLMLDWKKGINTD